MFKNHTSAHLRQILSCLTLFFSLDCPHPTAQTGLNGKKCLVQNNICTQLHPKAKFKHTLNTSSNTTDATLYLAPPDKH